MSKEKTEITTPIKTSTLQASLDKRSVKLEDFRIIKEILYPGAQKDETLLMALDYCKARNLDIMKRPIQIVAVWDEKTNSYKDTIWPSITEVRITATRTGKYAGKSKAAFGPMVTEKLDGVEVTYPEWCELSVYRLVEGIKCEFPATLYWKETYKTKKNNTTAPNNMWSKRNRAQLEKCTEAAALRSAFPEELGGDYIAEEAFNASDSVVDVTPKSKTANAHTPPKVIEESFAPKINDDPTESLTEQEKKNIQELEQAEMFGGQE